MTDAVATILHAERHEPLLEPEVYALLAGCGFEVPHHAYWIGAPGAGVPADVASLAAAGEVVLKIVAPGLLHKSDVGGVARADAGSLLEVAVRLWDEVGRRATAADRQGILVVERVAVVTGSPAAETLLSLKQDPAFGPVVVFGLGGIYTELLKDVTRRFAPFDANTAREMIDEIKGAALLHGFRGQPALDIDALADTLSRLSLLIADHADRIAEIDINPLFVRTAGHGVTAADALVVLK